MLRPASAIHFRSTVQSLPAFNNPLYGLCFILPSYHSHKLQNSTLRKTRPKVTNNLKSLIMPGGALSSDDHLKLFYAAFSLAGNKARVADVAQVMGIKTGAW